MRRVALAAAAALALGACLSRRPIPQTTEGEWAEARDTASRRRFLYDGFEHRATATATHLSLAVREARARRLALWFGWTQQELEKRLAQERKEAAEGEEFVIALYTAQNRQNDLDAPQSIWRVAMKVGDADLLARSVTALDRDATVTGLFPYVGPFDVVYRVVFPPAPGGPVGDGKVVLELASALGKIDLRFGEPNGAGPAQPEELR